MKVLNINSVCNSNFTKLILKKGLFVDSLLENEYFEITIKPEDSDKFVDLMYRILWETVYLKSGVKSFYNPHNDIITMYVSISEVIGFINKATPPRLQHLIPESIKTIDSILELLKQFLMDDNGGHLITYLSYFKEHFRFQCFETRWTYDKKRMEILRKMNPQGVLADVEVCTCSIDNILNKDSLYQSILLTFHGYTRNDIKKIYDIIYLTDNHLIISNIMKDNTGTYITAFSNMSFNPSKELKNIISKTHNSIS